MLQVSALQSGSKRGPGSAAVASSQERIVVKGQHHQRAVLIFVVDGHVENVLVLKAEVGGSKCCAAVFADLHALAFSAKNHAVGMFRIDDDRVNHPIAGSHALPVVLVGGL